MILDPKIFSNIVNDLHDGLYITDRNRIIQYWNKAAETISGFTAEEIIGTSCSDNILTHIDKDGNSLCSGLCPLAETISTGTSCEAMVYMHHRNGKRMPVFIRTSALTEASGTIIGGIELFTDMSNVQSSELRMKELEDMAYIDNLTRLANRNYIEKTLSIRFEEKKTLGIPFGVLFMDIDDFKSVNDTYGHDAGDKVLKLVSDTMTANSRPFDVFGRWGGEEFIGILRNVGREQIDEIGDRLRILIENSYFILPDKSKLNVTVSMGATLVEKDDNIDTLIKRVDILLYKSKFEGKNRLSIG